MKGLNEEVSRGHRSVELKTHRLDDTNTAAFRQCVRDSKPDSPGVKSAIIRALGLRKAVEFPCCICVVTLIETANEGSVPQMT